MSKSFKKTHMDDKGDKNIQEEKKGSTSGKEENKIVEPEKKPPPPTPPPPPPPQEEKEITLEDFCKSLPQTGVDRFAHTRILARIQDDKYDHITGDPKPRSEWEKLYLEIKNS